MTFREPQHDADQTADTGPSGAPPSDIKPLRPLEILSAALRMPMPDDFLWDYSTEFLSGDSAANYLVRDRGADHGIKCESVGCALGLASLLFPEKAESLRSCLNTEGIALALGFDDWHVADDIFVNANTYRREWRGVTPTDVADAIDHYLARGNLDDFRTER